MEIQYSDYLIKEGERKREMEKEENRKKNEILKKKIQDFIALNKSNPDHKRKINFIKFYDDKKSDPDFSKIIENNLFIIRINKSNASMGILQKKIYSQDDKYLASTFYKYDEHKKEFIFHIYDINNETIKKSEGYIHKKDFSDNNNLKNYDIFVVPENDDITFNDFFMNDKPNIDKNNNSSLLNRLNLFNKLEKGGKKRKTTKKTIKTTKKAVKKSRRKSNKK